MESKIKSFKPNIKVNTIKSYIGYYNRLHKALYDTPPMNMEWLDDVDKIKQYLNKQYANTTKKNIYNALVVILSANDRDIKLIEKYSELRDDEHSKYEELSKNHTKTEKMSKNWVNLKEIDKLLTKMNKNTNEVYKKKLLKTNEFNSVKEYIILLTYRNIPLRNDVANMRVLTKKEYEALSDDDKDRNNYLVGNQTKSPYKFYINDYKTKKTFGRKVIDIPKKVVTQIRKWLKINTTGYFIPNSNNVGITPNGITKLFNKIFEREFGKKVSTSMLRHIYLSDKYSNVLKEQTKDAYNMGHSLSMAKDYVKEDKSDLPKFDWDVNKIRNFNEKGVVS